MTLPSARSLLRASLGSPPSSAKPVPIWSGRAEVGYLSVPDAFMLDAVGLVTLVGNVARLEWGML